MRGWSIVGLGWLLLIVGCARSAMRFDLATAESPLLVGSEPGQGPWAGGLPLLRSLPDDTLRVPEHTQVRVRALGAVAQVEITQRLTVPADAPDLVLLWPRPPGAVLRSVELIRGGDSVSLGWQPADSPVTLTDAERPTQAARLPALLPHVEVWALTDLPPGERVLVKTRYVQPVERHDDHRVLTVPTTLGPTISGRPLYAEVADARVGLEVEVQAAAPIAAHRLGSWSADVQVEGSQLLMSMRTPGDGGEQRLEFWVDDTQPHAEMFVDPAQGHFALVITGPRAAAVREPEEVALWIDQSVEEGDLGLAIELERVLLERLRARDRFEVLNSYHLGSSGLAQHSAFVRAEPELRLRARTYGPGVHTPDLLAQVYVGQAGEPRERRIVLVTGRGWVTQPEDLAHWRTRMEAKGIDARVDVLTVDRRPMTARAEREAQAGLGRAVWVREHSSVRAAVDALQAPIEGEALTNVVVDWGTPVDTVRPDDPLAVGPSRQVTVYGRLLGAPPTVVQLSATRGGRVETIPVAVHRRPDSSLLRRAWARARIDHLHRAVLEKTGTRSAWAWRALAEKMGVPIDGSRVVVVGGGMARAVVPVQPSEFDLVAHGLRPRPTRPFTVAGFGCAYPGHAISPPVSWRRLDRSLFDSSPDPWASWRGQVEVQSSRGLEPADVRRLVRRDGDALGRCLVDALAHGEQRLLEFEARIDVEAGGSVSHVRRTGGGLPLLSTEDCLVDIMSEWSLSPTAQGTVVEVDLLLWIDRAGPRPSTVAQR